MLSLMCALLLLLVLAGDPRNHIPSLSHLLLLVVRRLLRLTTALCRALPPVPVSYPAHVQMPATTATQLRSRRRSRAMHRTPSAVVGAPLLLLLVVHMQAAPAPSMLTSCTMTTTMMIVIFLCTRQICICRLIMHHHRRRHRHRLRHRPHHRHHHHHHHHHHH